MEENDRVCYTVPAGVVVAPFIYMFAAVSAYYLYKDLRNVVNEASAGGMGAEEMGGGGYAAQREAPPPAAGGGGGGGQGWSRAEAQGSRRSRLVAANASGFLLISGYN